MEEPRRDETDGLDDEYIFECQVTSAVYSADLNEAFEDLQAGRWITLG